MKNHHLIVVEDEIWQLARIKAVTERVSVSKMISGFLESWVRGAV